ncbi:hypothetical protein EGJ52_04165 [Pseudomonas luteola]|uniref:recombinase family protein n=1 Tax=Pseudomonas luteola TaxID=47886 RepID=UPI000F7B167F|nr:hypothetical protein EGJ52_04165 [Pseudomonas luteola]
MTGNVEIPCIRYSRWSSGKQSSGDSRGRQAKLVERWLHSNPGAVLIDEFTDEGMSGWSGQHLSEAGELGRLVEAIQAGIYPEGTHLLVEAADRIGRLPMVEMLPLLAAILKAGVSIVLLETGQKYNKESLDGAEMYAIVGALQAAYAFSERLSKRIQSAWDRRKAAGAAGKAVGNRRLPVWLEKDGDSVRLNEPMAAFVIDCLELYCSGFGFRRILNEARPRHPYVSEWEAKRVYGKRVGAKLTTGGIQKWVEDQTSFELLRGHWNGVRSYPPPIPLDLWYRVKQERKRRLDGNTRTIPSRQHFLTSVCICGICGSPMNLKQARANRSLVCGRANRGQGCDNGKAIPEIVGITVYRAEAADWVERALATRRASPNMQRIMAIDSELADLKAGHARLIAALAKFPIPTFDTQMQAMLETQQTLEAERKKLQAEEDAAMVHLSSSLVMDEWQNSEHPSETLALGGQLRKVGFSIVCHPNGDIDVGNIPYRYVGFDRKDGTWVVEWLSHTSADGEEFSMTDYEGHTEAQWQEIRIRMQKEPVT